MHKQEGKVVNMDKNNRDLIKNYYLYFQPSKQGKKF